MTTETIIKKYLYKMKEEYPNWNLPEEYDMYCFSINQAREMLNNKERETIEEIEKILYGNNDICNHAKNIICIELDKLKEKQ